jgi:RNA polymerase sigma-70 factor (ECF subfamily)
MDMTVEISAAVGGSMVEAAAKPPLPSPECALLRRLQAGDELAYRSLVARYQNRILGLARGIVGNHEDAEEIAQRVFVNVFLSIGKFGGRSSIFTWIHRIAINECYSMLRARKPTVSLETQDTDGTVSEHLLMQDPGPNWDIAVVQRDYLNRLLEAIPERDKHLLFLREVEGLSVAEVAEGTGMSENSVKIRLCRARQRLTRAAEKLRRREWMRSAFRELADARKA